MAAGPGRFALTSRFARRFAGPSLSRYCGRGSG